MTTSFPRTLILSLILAILPSPGARTQEDAVPAPRAEAPPAGEILTDEVLDLMQEEIRLREELAAKIRGGVPESELEGLRGELERLGMKRRALAQNDGPLAADTADEPSATEPWAAETGNARRSEDWWRFIETFSRSYLVPLAAVAIAILLRWTAGRSVRRWLAAARARLPEREGEGDDPRWREAEACILRASSLAILAGLIAVLLIETGLLSGWAVAILLGLGLAVLWPFRRFAEDAIGGLTLLRAGSFQVGDMVDLAGRSGVVETSSLFSTTLRDTDGSVHFVPHRLVRGVRNSTYEWARAVIEVAVKPDEDLDRIMSLLLEVAHEVAQSPPFVEMVVEEPRMLGIESVEASQVVIRFFLKTAPRRRSMVKREVLRRLSRRFRELGIEAPIPAQRLHHKVEKPGEPERRGGE